MNGEWIYFEIARWIVSLVLAYIGYLLGIRSQKIQTLREYITGIVADDYPALFSEIKRNSERLDNFQEEPNVSFGFSELDNIYNCGLEDFMKKHHKDLFLVVDSFRRDVLSKFYELSTLLGTVMGKLFDTSSTHLKKSLPSEAVDTSERIAHDLSKSINPYYIIPDLLNERDEEVKKR